MAYGDTESSSSAANPTPANPLSQSSAAPAGDIRISSDDDNIHSDSSKDSASTLQQHAQTARHDDEETQRHHSSNVTSYGGNPSSNNAIGFLPMSATSTPAPTHKHILPLAENPIAPSSSAPLVPDSAIIADPLSFFLANAQVERDPSGFGLGSVADGLSCSSNGRRPHTTEQVCLFRSHRLLQAQAATLALNPLHTLTRHRLRQLSRNLERQVRQTVREQTNDAVERVAENDGVNGERQQAIVDAARRNCHRLLTGLLDQAASSLREVASSLGEGAMDPGFGLEVGSSSSSSGRRNSNSGLHNGGGSGNSNISENQQQLAPTWEEVNTPSSSTKQNPGWSSAMNTTIHPPAGQLHSHHMPMPPAMGRSSIFALPLMRGDRPQLPAFLPSAPNPHSRQSLGGISGLGSFAGSPPPGDFLLGMSQGMGISMNSGGMPSTSGGSAMPSLSTVTNQDTAGAQGVFDPWHVNAGDGGRKGGGSLARAMSSVVKPEKTKTALVTKMDTKQSSNSPPTQNYNNRKGSRHRLTPQAKGILENWLAKHWLNPYPTEDEKVLLANACLITVTQVNNWMMNVRVRRCRTKKIGLATGPEQITYPSSTPKAVALNRVKAARTRDRSPATSPSSIINDGSVNNERSTLVNDHSGVSADHVSSLRNDQAGSLRGSLNGQSMFHNGHPDISNDHSGTYHQSTNSFFREQLHGRSSSGSSAHDQRSPVRVPAAPWHAQDNIQQSGAASGGQHTMSCVSTSV